MTTRRVVVGITGASGAVYGLTALKALRAAGVETHLVVSRSAQITMAHETEIRPSNLASLADVLYRVDDIGAAISSGSFRTEGMIIAPCSVRSLSEIATGVTSSLLTRAADVVLKERRKLILLVRETPFHLGHLRSMTQVTEMGAIVMPPVPAFYTRPATLQDVVDHSVGRALDLLGLDTNLVSRWCETVDLKAKS
ncbi:MAG: putative aromatic acid decarboxylase [Bradyrhizobium sp.]|nr:putative aromatic acid decarboxylase [Bradyrhizobium sp.]MEA2868326.1 flavin prenyltransferase [Bradyrhizobium sp.]